MVERRQDSAVLLSGPTFFKIAEKQQFVIIVLGKGRAAPKLGNFVFGANMKTKLLAVVKL